MTDNSNYSVSPTKAALTQTQVQQMVKPRYRNTPPNLAELAFLQWLAATDAEAESLIRTYRDYYNGEHTYTLTDRMREFLELDPNVSFDLNYLPIPVDVLNERLNVVGFEVGGEDENTAVMQGGESGLFWQWWNASRMDALQDDVHHAALRDGDSYALTYWDAEARMPRVSFEPAYDGTSGIVVRYNEEDGKTIKFAVKRWRIERGPGAGQESRMNVYTADAIYKFIAGRNGWEEYFIEGQPWPEQWIGKDGRPLGVPVAHFPNNRGGYLFGKSELKDLIPAQDALSKAVIDELAGADIGGFRIITLEGGDRPDSLEVGPGRVLHSPQGKWGSIGADDIEALSSVVTAYVTRMAQMSRTPLSYFQITGQVASSETQRADDTGLVSKAEARAKVFGNAWEDVFYMARKLYNTFGPGGLTETPISTVWGSFERVDKGELDRKTAETAHLKAQTFELLVNRGVERTQAAILSGYTPEEAALMAQTGGRLLAQDSLNA